MLQLQSTRYTICTWWSSVIQLYVRILCENFWPSHSCLCVALTRVTTHANFCETNLLMSPRQPQYAQINYVHRKWNAHLNGWLANTMTGHWTTTRETQHGDVGDRQQVVTLVHMANSCSRLWMDILYYSNGMKCRWQVKGQNCCMFPALVHSFITRTYETCIVTDNQNWQFKLGCSVWKNVQLEYITKGKFNDLKGNGR